jgi:hypothetical protein
MQVDWDFWGDAGHRASPRKVSHSETSSIAEQVHSGSQHAPVHEAGGARVVGGGHFGNQGFFIDA